LSHKSEWPTHQARLPSMEELKLDKIRHFNWFRQWCQAKVLNSHKEVFLKYLCRVEWAWAHWQTRNSPNFWRKHKLHEWCRRTQEIKWFRRICKQSMIGRTCWRTRKEECPGDPPSSPITPPSSAWAKQSSETGTLPTATTMPRWTQARAKPMLTTHQKWTSRLCSRCSR